MQANKYSNEWLEQLQLLHLGLLEEPTWDFLWDDDSCFSEQEFKLNCTAWIGPNDQRIRKVTGIASRHECQLTVELDTKKFFSFKLAAPQFRQMERVIINLREFDIDSNIIRTWRPDSDEFWTLFEGNSSVWDTVWHWTETRDR